MRRAPDIDDHPNTELAARRLLREPGCDPIGHAMSGVEATQHLSDQTDPNLILLDLNLPGADGLAMIAPLRSAAPAVRILAFSMNDRAASSGCARRIPVLSGRDFSHQTISDDLGVRYKTATNSASAPKRKLQVDVIEGMMNFALECGL